MRVRIPSNLTAVCDYRCLNLRRGAKKMRSPAEASDPFELPAQKSEANLQAELGGTRCTQSVDAGSGSNPDILRAKVIGASDVARSPREIRAQDIRGKIEVSEVE